MCSVQFIMFLAKHKLRTSFTVKQVHYDAATLELVHQTLTRTSQKQMYFSYLLKNPFGRLLNRHMK